MVRRQHAHTRGRYAINLGGLLQNNDGDKVLCGRDCNELENDTKLAIPKAMAVYHYEWRIESKRVGGMLRRMIMTIRTGTTRPLRSSAT